MLQLRDKNKRIAVNGIMLGFEQLRGERAKRLIEKFPKLAAEFELEMPQYIIVKDGIVRLITTCLPSVRQYGCVVVDGQELTDCHRENTVVYPCQEPVPPAIGSDYHAWRNEKDRANPKVSGSNVFYHKQPDSNLDGKFIKVYQVYYNEATRKNCEPEFTHYENKNANMYLENAVIEDVYLNRRAEWQEYDYVGVLSHAFRAKSKFSAATLKVPLGGKTKDIQLYGLSHKNFRISTIQNDKKYHTRTFTNSEGRLVSAWEYIFRRILVERMGWPEKVLTMPVMPIYFNYWLIRTDIFERYHSELLGPVLAAMRDETDIDLQKALFTDSDYPKRDTTPHDKLISMFERKYYTMHPFVLERMISVWAAYAGIKQQNVNRF